MKTCEWCKKKFDPDDAEMTFVSEFASFAYGNIKKCLCGECAIQAIEDRVDGVYYETCERCGTTFDYIEDSTRFEDYSGSASLSDFWTKEILCADCASIELDHLGE